jgi:hypothetical protein
MSQLHDYLSALPPGPIEDRAELVRHLQACWDGLRGSNRSAMATWKLNRLEDPRWEPPLLSFAVERHGAMVGGGSTRAEMQRWVVDLRSATTRIEGTGRRQLRPSAARLDVRPLVEEIACLVAERAIDERLSWSDEGHAVRVAIGKVIPADGFQQTIAGRRKRFRAALDSRMAEMGWETAPTAYRYVRSR